MSTGFKNNNYGNINQYSDNWKGSNGYTITADGEKNIVFINPIYGLRALMVILSNKIKAGKLNISDIIRSYSPYQSEQEVNQRAKQISRLYFNNANVEDDILDLSKETIINLSKGLIIGEIPEYNSIPSSYYDDAYQYYFTGNEDIAKNYSLSNGSGSMVVILLLIVGAGYFISHK
jgi:hypothetical protein